MGNVRIVPPTANAKQIARRAFHATELNTSLQIHLEFIELPSQIGYARMTCREATEITIDPVLHQMNSPIYDALKVRGEAANPISLNHLVAKGELYPSLAEASKGNLTVILGGGRVKP